MGEVMSGAASPARLAGFLVALRAKGETVDELTALADTMLEHAVRIEVPGRTVDLVGTGGDRAHTVNISTMAALVVAGAGATVVKHGNRAASSSSGSADVLEALGVRLDQPVERVAELAHEVGITFCFAGRVPPLDAARGGGPARARRSRPAFNFLGPLTNPAQPAATAVGVSGPRGWRRSWPACSPRAGPTRWCSAARTGSTSSPPRRCRGSGRCATAS